MWSGSRWTMGDHGDPASCFTTFNADVRAQVGSEEPLDGNWSSFLRTPWSPKQAQLSGLHWCFSCSYSFRVNTYFYPRSFSCVYTKLWELYRLWGTLRSSGTCANVLTHCSFWLVPVTSNSSNCTPYNLPDLVTKIFGFCIKCLGKISPSHLYII